MRLAITNTTVVVGDGTTILPDCSVIVEDGLIVAIVPERYPYYDPADELLDAHGGFTIPGLINHHVHGLSVGPIQAIGQPPLSHRRATYNLDLLLSQGVTTALNVDGLPTVDEVDAVGHGHPVTLRATTLHTPTYLRWAGSERFGYGTLKERHQTDVATMLARGAVAVGEAGPGSDVHWPDYVLLPEAVERQTGQRLAREQAVVLRELVEQDAADSALAAALESFGIVGIGPDWVRELVAATVSWRELSQQACYEAARLARQHDAPLILHNTPAVADMVRAIADENRERVIAGHSNFYYPSVEEAVEVARYVKQRGGWVDIMGGDSFGGRRFFSSLELQIGMLRAGVVDLLSTDYCGGFWDPMLQVLDACVAAGAVSLAEAVALVTGNVARILPALAPNRGLVEVGRVADLVITGAGSLAQVRSVIVQGKVALRRG
jgi:alpha-D-ribose 1-methylphosphonate 5-triphosphate diphosphatase PhnM